MPRAPAPDERHAAVQQQERQQDQGAAIGQHAKEAERERGRVEEQGGWIERAELARLRLVDGEIHEERIGEQRPEHPHDGDTPEHPQHQAPPAPVSRVDGVQAHADAMR